MNNPYLLCATSIAQKAIHQPKNIKTGAVVKIALEAKQITKTKISLFSEDLY